MGRKGMGPAEVRDEDGELLMTLEERDVNLIMADVFTHFHRQLDNYAKFDKYCREHPRPEGETV